MTKRVVFSIIESPLHPDFSALYSKHNIEEVRFNSMRKAIGHLKKQLPDFVVAEFFYGYGNNYAGVNISNLDVFLHSLQKYAPAAKVIVLVDKQERQYVDKLAEMFKLHVVMQQPVSPGKLEQYLT